MYLTLYELSSNILLLRGERAVEAINKFAPIPLSSVWVKRVYKHCKASAGQCSLTVNH